MLFYKQYSGKGLFVEMNEKYITEEEPKKVRRNNYVKFSVVFVFFLLISIIAFILKSDETAFLSWLSNLFLNLSAGTAITAFFYYFSNIRIIKYKLYNSITQLRYLINTTYLYMHIMKSSSNSDKRHEYIGYVSFLNNYPDINFKIIKANKPELYEELERLHCYTVELQKAINKTNGLSSLETEEIIKTVDERGIEINEYHIGFIKNLIEVCNKMKQLL